MPPRSHRGRTISYNLTSASARAAFVEGLDYHEDLDEDAPGSPKLTGTSPPGSSFLRRSAPSAFSDINGRGAQHTLLNGHASEQQAIELVQLLELFTGADRQLVAEVYAGCDHHFDSALTTLSDMLGGGAGEGRGAEDALDAHAGVGSMGGVHGERGMGEWNDLPEEVKELILGFLPTLDVARAAATCKDFARRVRMGAINAKVLSIPLGLSLSGIIGMVAGHPNAHTVSLARWAKQGLQDRDFAALLTAISNGSRSSRRNTPVESLSLRGWSGLKDGHVMTLCSTLQHLKELDLTDCTGITDASLSELSKYQRALPPERKDLPAAAAGSGSRVSGAGQGQEGEDEEGEEAGMPGVAVAAGEDEDLQFEMEAAPVGSEAAAGPPGSAAGTPVAGMGPGGPEGDAAATPLRCEGLAWEDLEEEEEDEDEGMRQARLESLAALASSPPISSLLLPACSPPSSLMAPERALGAHMARLALGGGKAAPGAGASLAAVAPGPKGTSGGGSITALGKSPGDAAAASPGWVGSWQKASNAAAAAGLGVVASSPPAAASPSGHYELLAPRPPRLASAAGRGLRSLVLAGCAQVSADGVRSLLAASVTKSSLEALDVSRCQRMTRQALQVPPASCLRVLKCASCNNLHEVIIQLPPTYPLTELHLNNCKQLSKLLVVAPNLRLLHVGGCKSMVAMSLRCTQMTQLLANLCFRWSEVTPEQWVCPRLQHLNLFGARHLETASLAAMLQNSTALRHLNLNGCNALSALTVTSDHSALATLDVSGCKGLVGLSVASPALRELSAKACPRLAEVSLDSRQLQRLDLSHCTALQRLHLPALHQQRQQLQAQMNADAVGASAAQVLIGPLDGAAALLPQVCTLYAERLLPSETQLLLRMLKAARRRALTAAAADSRVAAATGS